MGRSSRVWYCVPAGWKKTDIPFDSQKTRVYTPRSFLSVIMMNIAFITCFVGVLGMCAGASLAEGKPWSGEKVPLAEDGAVVLDDNEYLLNLADYEKLEQGGGLLVRYAAGKNGLREDSGAFYFENSHGKMVSAAVEPVSGNAGKTEPERLALVSPAFPLNPEGKWSLKRKSRPAELYRKKVAVSHMDQEYTFQSHEDAQVKLVHGVLANALVSGNNRSKSYNSFKVSRPAPRPRKCRFPSSPGSIFCQPCPLLQNRIPRNAPEYRRSGSTCRNQRCPPAP